LLLLRLSELLLLLLSWLLELTEGLLLSWLLELTDSLLLNWLLELTNSLLLCWLLLELVHWLLLANILRVNKLVQLLDLIRGQLLSINGIVDQCADSRCVLTWNRNKLIAAIATHLEAIWVISAGQHTCANSVRQEVHAVRSLAALEFPSAHGEAEKTDKCETLYHFL